MLGPYAHDIRTGAQSVTTTPVQLAGPSGVDVVQALIASDSEFSWSRTAGGTYRPSGLNAETGQYEKLFPVEDVFTKIWVKSASGTISIEWEALINTVT